MKTRASRAASSITYEEWSENSHVQTLATSDLLGWSNVHVRIAELGPPNDYSPNPMVGDYFLIAVLEGNSRLKIRFGKHASADVRMISGDLELMPPFEEAYSLWDAPITNVFVRFPCDQVMKLAGELYRGDPKLLHMDSLVKFTDPLLRELVGALCSEMYNNNPLGMLYAESLTRTMVLHLLTHYSDASPTPTISISQGKFTAQQMRVLQDYIHGHLDQKISLDDLAALLFMSVPHFERLFRASFGCAPYRYVLGRRIERAKGLLANSGISLHEIARQSGFANQSHFTKHFTRFVGCSPARYRSILNE